MSAYDPYLYHFMRACGAPAEYYPTYLTELTPMHLRRRRRARRISDLYSTDTLPTAEHPSHLGWVTPNIIALSNTYARDDTTVHTAERNVTAAEQRLVNAATPLLQAGAKRTLLYRQAELLAALVRRWHDQQAHERIGHLRIQPGVPIEVSDARNAKKLEKQEQQEAIRAERSERKRLAARQADLNLRWQHVKEDLTEASRAYMQAKAAFRIAKEQMSVSRSRRRLVHANAKAPTSAVEAFKRAQDDWHKAAAKRAEAKEAWKKMKDRRYRLNRHITARHPDMNDVDGMPAE